MIGLVTDSTSDLPSEACRQWGIRVVPTCLVMGGQSLQDGVQISRTEFYERLPLTRPRPTTAAPSAGEFEAAYRALFDAGADRIVSIHTAASLSGILNAARLGAESAGGRVTVLDSRQTSMGLGFQVLAAAEAIRQGRPLSAVVDAVRQTAGRVRLFALLDTLEYLRQSGRVGWVQAGLGEVLGIRLLIELAGGQVLRVAQARARSKGMALLAEKVAGLGRLERLAVLHTGALEDARALAEQWAHHSATPPTIQEVTPVIGTHVGPRGLGAAAVVASTHTDDGGREPRQ